MRNTTAKQATDKTTSAPPRPIDGTIGGEDSLRRAKWETARSALGKPVVAPRILAIHCVLAAGAGISATAEWKMAKTMTSDYDIRVTNTESDGSGIPLLAPRIRAVHCVLVWACSK